MQDHKEGNDTSKRQVLTSFNIDERLVQAIQALYENSSGAALLNSQLWEFFNKECLLSAILFNLFPEKKMKETLHDHHTSILIGGRPICNLQFADDINHMVKSNWFINHGLQW